VIADTLVHSARYAALHPAFGRAFAWLSSFPPTVADGTHAIGAGCEARVMTYLTAGADEKRWESHRRYIDIQYVVRGMERMDVSDIARLRAPTPYNDAEDVMFYGAVADGAHQLFVGAGEFTIFFPTDGHRPSIAVGAPAEVRKIVIKVPVGSLGA
jgi:biofilm protein TabA